MAYITWTKTFSSADDGSILTGAQLGNLQGDITAAVNGGITNVNVNNTAAIDESKLAFNITTGHTHNGTDARFVSLKHYRKGGLITRVDASNITVGPIIVDVSGSLLKSTATSNSIDITSAGNWLNSESEPADGAIFIVAYNNSGVPGFKLCTSAPTLSYSDDTTAEYPLRYIKFSSTYYRYIGVIHNRTDLVANSIGHFDRTNIMMGSFVSDNADETITTLWTPKYIQVFQCADATPADTEAYQGFEVFKYGFDTAAPYPATLNYASVIATHNTVASTTVGSIKTITAQIAGTAGSFTLKTPTNGVAVSYIAMTDEN